MSASTNPRPPGIARGIAIGVDTGGTHTDLVLTVDGRVVTMKIPSTPQDLAIGILEGVRKIAAISGHSLAEVDRFVYASTLVTNLIVEEQESNIGLITTDGFRDVLEIRRA